MHNRLALSGEAALDKLTGRAGEEVGLLMSNIKMPGVNGLNLLPVVEEWRPDLPVFMISAFGDTDTVATTLARGANEFFTKPVDFPKLRRDIMAAQADAMRRNT
jgi:DNA-binding NtrC family response regulator